MAAEENYAPSPADFVREQVEQYEATGGAEGRMLQGAPCIILTTTGRKTGKIRKTPLMRVEHDGSYAVVASMGGAPKHPVWYLNMLDDPAVKLQDGPEVREYRARDLSGDEKAQWWARATEVWPAYDEYQTKTSRDIPLVLLERPS